MQKLVQVMMVQQLMMGQKRVEMERSSDLHVCVDFEISSFDINKPLYS